MRAYIEFIENLTGTKQMDTEVIPEFRNEIREHDIVVTPAAGEQLVKLFNDIDDDEVEAIRVFVAGGGCSGMRYGMTFTDRKLDYDCVLEGEGYRFYVDAIALSYLRGVEIDYVSRETDSTFVFNNVFQAVGGSGLCGACGAAVGAGGGCG